MRKRAWLICVSGLLAACGSDGGPSALDAGTDEDGSADEGGHSHDGEDGEKGESPSGAICPPGSQLTYDNFAQGFFGEYCVGCHAESVAAADREGAPLDHNFDTLHGIEHDLAHIDSAAAAGPEVVNETMPPSGEHAPSLEERRKLGEWIACGAREQ